MSSQIIETVVSSISKVKEISPEKITLDSTLEELKMDSLDALDLFFELEERFDLTMPDEDARSLRTVNDIVESIEKLLAAKRPGDACQSVE